MKTGKQIYSNIFLYHLAKKCIKDGTEPEIYRKLYFNDSELSIYYIKFITIYKTLKEYKESMITLSICISRKIKLTWQEEKEMFKKIQAGHDLVNQMFDTIFRLTELRTQQVLNLLEESKQVNISSNRLAEVYDKIVYLKDNITEDVEKFKDSAEQQIARTIEAKKQFEIKMNEIEKMKKQYMALDDYAKLLLLGIF